MGFRELLRDLKNHLGTYQSEFGEGANPPSLETPETIADSSFSSQPVTILVPAGNGPVHSLKQLRTAEVEPDTEEPAPSEEPALETDPDTLLSLAEPEEERQQPPEPQPHSQDQDQDQDLAQSLVRQPIRPLTRTTVPSTGVAGSWNRNRDRHPWFTGRWWSAG